MFKDIIVIIVLMLVIFFPSLTHSQEIIQTQQNIKGIYVTGWVAGLEERMNKLIDLANKSVINAMVIDVKDSRGHLSYPSRVYLANKIRANENKIFDIKNLLIKLDKNNIYTIARIVVFKDGLLASQRPDLSMKLWSKQSKIINRSNNWVDPAKEEVVQYNIELAKEAFMLGFDEVQFDYIRFPALANQPIQVIVTGLENKDKVIVNFLKKAKYELKNYGPFSIDVFGLTTSVEDDLGIGQNLLNLSKNVNIISPMIYPSHYANGSFGIALPENEPYKTIFKSMSQAQRKFYKSPNVRLRPWLQDFSVKVPYEEAHVLAQIQALQELGIDDWLLWNPASRYTWKVLEEMND